MTLIYNCSYVGAMFQDVGRLREIKRGKTLLFNSEQRYSGHGIKACPKPGGLRTLTLKKGRKFSHTGF